MKAKNDGRSGKRAQALERQARLSKALKANLKRRKAQVRGRKQA